MRLKKLIVAGLAAYGGVQLAEKWAAANKELLQHKLEDALIRGMQFIFDSPTPSEQVDEEERTYVVKLAKDAKLNIGDEYFYYCGGDSFFRTTYRNTPFDHDTLQRFTCYILRKE